MTTTTAATPGLQPQHVDNTVATRIRRLVQTTFRLDEVGAVCGPSGVGKSYLVRRFADELDVEVHRVSLPRRAPRKEVLVRLHADISGEPTLPKGESYVLREEIAEMLAGREAVVIVDEAHGLDDVALDCLSNLHGDPRARWTLLLVGSPKLGERLETYEHLASRCTGVLRLKKLPDKEVLHTVRGMHPIFVDAPDAVLRGIDSMYAKGNLRRWVRVLRIVEHIGDDLSQPCSSLDIAWGSLVVEQLKGLNGDAA